MLRITIHDEPPFLTFQLEGKLAGPFVREFEECWRSTVASRHGLNLRVDLTGMTLIDERGKACLAQIYGEGAEFITADCLASAIVEEIILSATKLRTRRG